jgi:hypothetical protein
MGEAKRRKQLGVPSDPNWRKDRQHKTGSTPLGLTFVLDAWKNVESAIAEANNAAFVARKCTKLPPEWEKESPDCDLFHEAVACNFFVEKAAIAARKNNGWPVSEFDQGRLLLFENLEPFILLNAGPVDSKSDPYVTGIKEAGQAIWDSWKSTPRLPNPMHDGLIWLFIPKKAGFHSLVSSYWHGIGDWRH